MQTRTLIQLTRKAKLKALIKNEMLQSVQGDIQKLLARLIFKSRC